MLAMLKRILGITDNSQDATLSALLVEAQGYVEDFLGRSLDFDLYQDITEPNGSTSIWLRNFPIGTVASIETLSGVKVNDFKVIKSTGLVRTTSGIYEDVLIEYEGGFQTLPPWAMKAIVDTAASLYDSMAAPGIGNTEEPGACEIPFVSSDGTHDTIPLVCDNSDGSPMYIPPVCDTPVVPPASGGRYGRVVKSEEIVGVAKVTYETSVQSANEYTDGSVGVLSASTVDMLERHKNRYA